MVYGILVFAGSDFIANNYKKAFKFLEVRLLSYYTPHLQMTMF